MNRIDEVKKNRRIKSEHEQMKINRTYEDKHNR